MKKLFYYSNRCIHTEEVPVALNDVVKIVLSHNPTLLGINPFYQKLLEKLGQYELLAAPGSHPLSAEIKRDRLRLLKVADSIVLQAQSVEKLKLDSRSEAANLLVPIIKRYFKQLSRKNSKMVKKQVKNFLVDIDSNEQMRTACTTLVIAENVAELKLVHERLEGKTDKRRADKSNLRDSKRQTLKAELLDALSHLLRAIELGKVQHAELDYMPLIMELNELFVSYRALGRSRATRNKNVAIKNKTVATSTTTSATVN